MEKMEFNSDSFITFEYKEPEKKEDLQFILLSDKGEHYFLDVALIRETIKMAIKSFEAKKISSGDFLVIIDALSKISI